MQIYMFGYYCLLFVIAVKSLREGFKKRGRKFMEFSIATYASSIATHCFDQVTIGWYIQPVVRPLTHSLKLSKPKPDHVEVVLTTL